MSRTESSALYGSARKVRLGGAMSNDVLPAKMRQAAVYFYLICECLSITVDTMRDATHVWGLQEEDVFRLAIRSCPSKVTGLIAASACAEKFGKLFDIPGFYLCNGCWWLDVDSRLSHRGLLVPVRDSRLWIVGLHVFRHARDERPFMLRVRPERWAA